MANIQDERREVFKSIYGVTLMGSFNKGTKKTTPNSVLNNFEQDYNRYKNKGINKLLELYRDYSYAIFFMYSPSSIRNNLVAFRNVIKANGGKYQANALEAFTVESVYTPLNKENFDKKTELKEAVQKGKNTKIDPQVVINQIKALKEALETKSYSMGRNQKEEQVRAYHIVAMLGLATGRRFTELLKTLVIEKKGKKVTFGGLLKGNDKKIEGNIIELTYKEVQGYLEELRVFAKTESMTESQVNSKYAKVFNDAMVRLVKSGLIDDLPQSKKYGEKYLTRGKNKGSTIKTELFPSIKTMRSRYSIAGSQLFKREGESLEDTITRILGHRENFTSALNYT